MSVEENKVLAHRYYSELMSSGDLSFVDKYFAPEFEFTNPTHPEPYRGQEFKDLVTMLRGAFPDLKFTVEHMVAEGDTVVGHWTARGTHNGGPLETLRGDIPAKGLPFAIDGMSWLRIVDGKFVEARINEDTLGLLRQIGAFPSPAPLPQATTPEENQVLARRYFQDLMTDKNLDAVEEIIAPNFALRIPTLPEPIRGPEGMKGFINRVRTGIPDAKFTIERQIAEGNRVASRWYMEGTHQGLFMGVEGTGNTVKDQGVDIFTMAGGKIVEVWVNEDGLGLLKQVGAFS